MMHKLSCLSLCLFQALFVSRVQAATPDCQLVRFADVGWTDISSTTAVAASVLEGMGFKTKTQTLSVPITFASMKNRDIDVFLGNWMPSMAADIKPYAQEGSVETLGPVLEGARYTLAVPKYVADAGVKEFSDLAKFKDKFSSKIYGIEAGNDGNRNIQKIIDTKEFGLGTWKLVESSEQGMLTQVMRSVSTRQWVVFLAWEPHPMNRKMELTYLKGGDKYFGPDQGRSTVFTTTRKGYAKECPLAASVIKKMTFTLEEENELMSYILDDKKTPAEAARIWLKAHPEKLNLWLSGLKAVGGEPAGLAVRKSLGLTVSR